MINSRYRIIKKLGKGRSDVFLCHDTLNSNKTIALKVLQLSESLEENRSFIQEYYTLKNLEHPSIIRVFDKGVIFESEDEPYELKSGSLYYTLEYFEGKELSCLADPDEKQLIDLIVKLSSVLFYLHQSNYIYYDIKPENILFTSSGNEIEIKLIDFGLARHKPPAIVDEISGTREYIAPELLRKDKHDHRVDLYSLGILLYEIIYKRLPFSSTNEIEIYKAQIEKEFNFPESHYSDKIINVLKKLLAKDPQQRYSSSYKIISDLNPEMIDANALYWKPAKVFTNRKDSIRILKKYLTDKEENEVFTVLGSTGAGKSSLLLEFNKLIPDSLYLNYDRTRTNISFIREFLINLLYTPAVFNNLSEVDRERIKVLIFSDTDNIVNELTSIISLVSRHSEITLLFDNYNISDEYVKEVFQNIIPIMQVNRQKLIFSEDVDEEIISRQIPNRRELNLTSFTDTNFSDYLTDAYADFFPISELKKIVLLYADLMPGNIVSFIKDLLVLKILRYSDNDITIDNNESSTAILKTSHDNIYRLRLLELNTCDYLILDFISALNTPIDEQTLIRAVESYNCDVKQILQKLRLLNIIQSVNQSYTVAITSEGLKNYIYKNINDKPSQHLFIATELSQLNFNRIELAQQFLLADYCDKSYEILYEELYDALKVSAFSYARSLLEKLLKYNVSEEKKRQVKKDLSEVLFNLGIFKEALLLLNEVITFEVIAEESMLISKASCLIGLQEFEQAKSILNSIQFSSEANGRKIKVELANAEFELNNYAECASICNSIISDENATPSEKGKCFNFLALINIFLENNISIALQYFLKAEDIYYTHGIQFKAAQMQMNLGNIYNIKGNSETAEQFWDKSFRTITAIGNLELEAKLLLNYGIYYFDKLRFEEAIDNYNKALSIFVSLGNSNGQGLVLYNMGEINLVTCEYQKSLEQLNASVQIFARLKNLNEELESLFLLGKVYFKAGDLNQVSFIVQIISNKVQKENTSERHYNNLKFIEILASVERSDNDTLLPSLKECIETYGRLDNKIDYCFAIFIYVTICLQHKRFEEALSLTKDSKFIEFCSNAPVLNAERIYLTGMIARSANITEKSSFDYFIEVAEFVQSSSIIEITWKIFYNLGELYEQRGSITKAEEYYLYAKSVLEYIISNTTDKNLRNALLNNPERNAAFTKLSELKEITLE